MTSVTMAACERNMDTAVRPRGSLEELVDRLMKTLFSADSETAASTPVTNPVRATHEARRFSQTREIDAALSMLGGMDMSVAETCQTRWAFTEWRQLVRRRFGDRGALN